jgi:predicted nucleotidyltransferase
MKPNKDASDFYLWEQLSQKRETEKEKNRLRALGELKHALNNMRDEYKWEELYIFGSIIRKGNFNQYSDLDIGVQGLNKFLHYKFVADISLKLNRDVDVVRLEDCTFAKSIMERGLRWTKEM